MLPGSRRRRRAQNIENESPVEVTSPEPAPQDTTPPDKIPLPPSRASSPVSETVGVVQPAPGDTAAQQGSIFDQGRAQHGPDQGISQEDAGDNNGAASEPAPPDDTSPEWPNPFAIGQEKLAEFWPVYVKEADAYDKELAEGWNNMLEVILIFAALFSAISTAFVLESSKDLKPDPAESAAATLLLISQTLLAMSNQSALVPGPVAPEPTTFVPSGSAVAVNVLWFTSLILSVSVTLIAMLAKEWSHLFMVGRTGMPMEQARKRQKRFEGMKAWKMAGVITALPTLMHLALFLFAAGLCVYLWDIHKGVAVPVVVLTLLTASIYVAALVLPLIYDYCPYATALSKLIKPLPGTWSRKREAQPDLDLPGDKVPMDVTTSHSLAWMISNSEVPNSVDLAVQAIAGTSFVMPTEMLWDCSAASAIHSRLQTCLGNPDGVTLEQLKMLLSSDSTAFVSMVAYAQALNLMAVERREWVTSDLGKEVPLRKISYEIYLCEGLYESLWRTGSSHFRAVRCAARAMNNQIGEYSFYDKSNHLLAVSELVIQALQQLDTPSSGLFLSTLFAAFCSEAALLHKSPELPTERSQILQNVLAIIPLADEKGYLSKEFAKALCVIGLAMSKNSTAPLGEAAIQFFASDTQELIVRKHPNVCVSLGLSGLVRVMKSENLLDSRLDSLFRLFGMYPPDQGELAELSPNPFGSVDIVRCVAETAFDCHQSLTKQDTEMPWLDEVLGRVLQPEHKPWSTSIVAGLLENPASNNLRYSCVHFVAQTDPREARLGVVLVSNAFYEAVRLEDIGYEVTDEKALRLTRHFEIVSANGEQDTSVVAHALLQRLLVDDLFRCLLTLMNRTRPTGTSRRWQGMKAGYVVQFWGEHIIEWGRKMLLESENSGDVEKLRELFSSEEEITDGDGDTVEGAMELRNLLWPAISQREDPRATSGSWIPRFIRLPWRSGLTGNAPAPTPAESV